jgi:CubicO group peptidase (beta-lactamase class C family)
MKHALVCRKLERVENVIEQAIGRGEIPGGVIRARMGSELRYDAAFGAARLLPERHEAHLDTVYDLASLTKVMATTAAVMCLVADGKLSLEQPVAEVLPAFATRGKGSITLRHLLTHSAGLRPWRAYYADLRDRELRRGETLLCTEVGRASIVDRVVRSSLVHNPGEASVYGDLDFIVLGAVVEQAAGERLDQLVSRRIYGPLGMTRTHFNPLPFAGSRRTYAATEQCPWRERILWGEVHDPNAWAMGGVAGHAGLFGTAADVMRFADEMLAAERGESAVFDGALARQFFTRQEIAPDSDWALGWDTPTAGHSTSGEHFSRRSIGHTGFTGTSVWIDLERDVVIVALFNRVHLIAKKSRFSLRPMIHDLVYDAFLAA